MEWNGTMYKCPLIGTRAQFSARPRVGVPRVRKVSSFLNSGPNVKIGVHENTFDNTVRAVLERVHFVKDPTSDIGFREPPKPTRNFTAALQALKRRLFKVLPSTSKFSLEEFVNTYDGRKKTIYEAAVKEYTLEGVSRRDAQVCAFVKAEKTNFTAKPDPAPRIIQPRRPKYNVGVGVYLKALEHPLYDAMRKAWKGTHVMKNCNADEMGVRFAKEWARFTHPVAIMIDASRFDQHCSKQALRWEHGVYLRAFRNDPELARLLAYQLVNHCVAYLEDGVIKYTTDGCRMSGDMNTGMGNCLLMCAMVNLFFEEQKVRKFSLLNNGDDCVLIMEARHEQRIVRAIPDWFLDFGYTMKVEDPAYELEHIEFCQMHPVSTGTRTTMVRNLGTAMAKDLITIKNVNNPGAWNAYRKLISDCGIAMNGDIPVMGAFYDMIGRGALRAANDPYTQGIQYAAHGLHHKRAEPTVQARLSFETAFGITPPEQAAMEQLYDATRVGYDPQYMRAPFSDCSE